MNIQGCDGHIRSHRPVTHAMTLIVCESVQKHQFPRERALANDSESLDAAKTSINKLRVSKHFARHILEAQADYPNYIGGDARGGAKVDAAGKEAAKPTMRLCAFTSTSP